MIVTRLSGGLGNQLFQYAAGRCLALRQDTTLKLDLGHYEKFTDRNFALDAFRIRAEIARPEELDRLLAPDALWRRSLRRLLPTLAPRHRFVFRERSYSYDPRLKSLRGPVYLIGYWQSERYFADHEPQLRDDLRWTADLNVEAMAISILLMREDSVALHVRRGDYVSNLEVRRRMGLCEPDYYRRAVAALADRRRLERAFLFSDDPQAVRQELDLDVPIHVVSRPGASAAEDLRLFSACPNKILSNSSFSWWGAWLGRPTELDVIAPRKWFLSADLPDRDLVLAHWIRL